MKLLSERIGQELRWVKPKVLRAEYELREGDEVFGRIVGKGRSLSAIEIETASGSWRVEQKGSYMALKVLTLSTQTELASVKVSLHGEARLLFADGREYRWQCTSFWRSVWIWLNDEGAPLMSLKRGSLIHLETAAQDLPEVALLAGLSWYLWYLQQMQQDVTSTIVHMM